MLEPPTDFNENLEYRKEIREWAVKKKANRDWLNERCKEDLSFWIQSFVWLFEPRPDPNKPPIIPFIIWESQKPLLTALQDHLGYKDIGVDKARGEGVTWCCLMTILWRWIYYDMQTFGLVSRNELAADNPQDPDSLGWKIDWELEMLPRWMVGKKNSDKGWFRNISKHTWQNKFNGSSITAYPATGELASGGRKTAFFMDELSKFPRGPDEEAMSATEPVTNSRLIVSTPAGADGAYYHAMTEESNMIKVTMDWRDNPTRNEHLFKIDLKGKTAELTPVDEKDPLPEGYEEEFKKEHLETLRKRGFDIDNKKKTWSPWFVERCCRPRMTPRKIAQEYERDYSGAGSRFFPGGLIVMLRERTRRPRVRGELIIDRENCKPDRFVSHGNGGLMLWSDLNELTKAPIPANYVIGADIASGIGGTKSSNSALSIINRDTGIKVAQYLCNTIKPAQFAELTIALCHWFINPDNQPAYLIWENNGYGSLFRDRLLETDFDNFHWRSTMDTMRKKTSQKPGWHSTKDTKRDLLGRYLWALQEGTFDNPCDFSLAECLCYINAPNGKVEYTGSTITTGNKELDPANAGENHGDTVIADALANYGMEELNGGTNRSHRRTKGGDGFMGAPENSFLWRRQQHLKKIAEKARGEDW